MQIDEYFDMKPSTMDNDYKTTFERIGLLRYMKVLDSNLAILPH